MKKKSIRLKKIERATQRLTNNYYEKWVEFVDSNCAKCQYGQFTNKSFGYDNHVQTYPDRCLYWDKVLKPLIKMHVILNISCGNRIIQDNAKPNVVIKQEDFNILL